MIAAHSELIAGVFLPQVKDIRELSFDAPQLKYFTIIQKMIKSAAASVQTLTFWDATGTSS
jgi:hypothetical protein